MEFITPSMLQSLNVENKRLFESLLPLLIKKLIIQGSNNLSSIRMPSGNDIWANGFDGVISCDNGSTYVSKGVSVWEFGTSEDSLKKINDDYEKRTNNTLGIDKENAVFYLVMPKIWAYRTSLTEWESMHNDWKEVHIYDASVLCDWINSDPAVCAWLFETIFHKQVDFTTLTKAWEEFSNKTNPCFTPLMFIEDREEESCLLFSLLDNNEIIRIKGDSLVDSIGFTLCALMRNPETREKAIVVNSFETLHTLSRIVSNKIFILNFFCFRDIPNTNNHFVVCFNKEATSISPSIQLKQYSKMHYLRSLREMGIPEGKDAELYAFCHASMRALVRRIPGRSNDSAPEWANKVDTSLLIPLMLMHTISIDNDRKIVESLSNRPVESVFDYYHNLSMWEDTPVKEDKRYYIIVNYEETWNTLNLNTDSEAFRRLNETILMLFNQIQLEGLYSGEYGSPHDVRRRVRDLLLNYIYFAYDSDDPSESHTAVGTILEHTFNEKMEDLLIANLSILAEAAPLTVIKFIANNLEKDQSDIVALFQDAGYSRYYVGVLFALDELTLHSETAVEACRILFKLRQLETTLKSSNTPKESLLTALCLFNSETALTIVQKTQLIRSFASEVPQLAYDLIPELIGKDSFWKGVRQGAKKPEEHEELTVAKLLEATETLAEMAIQYAVKNANIQVLAATLEQYEHVRPSFLIDVARKTDLKAFGNFDFFHLKYYLRERVYSIQKYDWENETGYISALNEWRYVLNQDKSEGKDIEWMFYKAYELPAEELLGCIDDYMEEEKKRDELRGNKLKAIYGEKGFTGIEPLLVRMEDSSYWGKMIATILSEENYLPITRTLLDQKKYVIMSGIIDNANFDLAKKVYDMVPSESQERLLNLITRKECARWLLNDDQRIAFWKTKRIYSFDTFMVEELQKYNPMGLLPYCFELIQKDYNHGQEYSFKILNLVVEKYEANQAICLGKHTIKGIIGIIEKHCYSEKWGELVARLYLKGFLDELPEIGKEYYYNNPEQLKCFITDNPSRYCYELLRFKLPECAIDNYQKLVDFISYFIDNSLINFIGQTLGRFVDKNNKDFPCPVLKNVLEEFANNTLDKEVLIGFLNSRGSRIVTDGSDQLTIAKEYKKRAVACEISYPHSAYILNHLAKSHQLDSKQDHILSEINLL